MQSEDCCPHDAFTGLKHGLPAGIVRGEGSEVTVWASPFAVQQVLYDTSKRFEFVVTEAALRFLLCPRAAMLAQLDRLLAIVGLAHVKLGVIPFGVELPTAPQNSFVLFDDLAVVETFVSETMHHDAEAAAYESAMDSLTAEAQHDAACRQIILRAMNDLRGAEPTARG